MSLLSRQIAAYRGADLPPTVRSLGATSFFQDVASDMVYPLLPVLLSGMGAGAAVFGVMESVSDGLLSLVKGWVGRRSDRTGRRRSWVVAGYGLSAALRPALVLATASWHVVGLRVLDRLAKGLRTAPRDAMIADAVDAPRRAYAFAFHRGLDHLGAAVGPLVAAGVLLLAPGNLQLVFLLATVPATIGVLVLVRGTRDGATVDAGGVEVVEPAGTGPLLPGPLRMPLLAVLVFSIGNASDGFLLLLMHDVGFPAWSLPLAWSAFHVAKSAASVPAGRIADRTSRRWALVAGWATYAVAYLGFAASSSAAAVAALLALYAMYYGITEGAERALMVELAGSTAGHGTSLGAYHAVSGVGVLASSAVFGIVWEVAGRDQAFLLGAGLAGVAALIMSSVRYG